MQRHQPQAHSQTFFFFGGGGGEGGGLIGQILGPFMITHELSCDHVGFGPFEGGSDDPPSPDPLWLRA